MAEDSRKRAVQWMIALQEKPDDAATVDGFMAWLMASEANKQAWSTLERGRGLAYAARDAGVASMISDIDNKHTTNTAPTGAVERLRQKRHVVSVSLVALAAVLLVYLSAPMIWLWMAADHRTHEGKMATITLQDGSSVQLGADSAIAVDFSKATRNVSVLVGEAYFEVKSEVAPRPFVVTSGAMQVRVTGTAFEVRRRRAASSVSVSEGEIRVQSATGPTQRAVVVSAGNTVVQGLKAMPTSASPTDSKEIAAWREGRLYVEDWSLADVVDVLNRYSTSRMVLAVWQPSRIRVTGVYNLKRPLNSLRLIALSNGLRVRSIGSGLHVLSPY
ncbi:MAG: FecR domain-containing protein [Pseudomonadota bacterium]